MHRQNHIIERLQQTPYWIIDFLPQQVPAGAAGQYFKVESMYLSPDYTTQRAKQFTNIMLKLNCFYTMSVSRGNDMQWVTNPTPSMLAKWIENCLTGNANNDSALHVHIDESDTLFSIYRDFTHMTVYQPNESLLNLLQSLVSAEGLFMWEHQIINT